MFLFFILNLLVAKNCFSFCFFKRNGNTAFEEEEEEEEVKIQFVHFVACFVIIVSIKSLFII